MSGTPEPFTAEDYFSLLLRRAQRAESEGNYAISAAAVARHGGIEVVALGANSLFAGRNPTGHAEVNAIMTLRSIAAAPAERVAATLARGEQEGSIVVRAAPSNRSEAILYTTLEPCPMCTVCTINSGIGRVVIAAEDPPSGSFAPERLAALPDLWPDLAKGIEVVWAQSDDAGSPESYLPPALLTELIDTFLNSRKRLDSHLSEHGTLDLRVDRRSGARGAPRHAAHIGLPHRAKSVLAAEGSATTAMLPSDLELHQARRQLLTTALGDVKGSIHANDQKVSAALVVNGLLLTSVVTVVTHTEGIYKKAGSWAHTLGVVLLALALVTFVASVGYLLSAMSPYRPKTLEAKIKGRYPRVFFPLPGDIEEDDPFGTWRTRVGELREETILDELTAEVLKLADILHMESEHAKKGYEWLVLEGAAVILFFVLVASVAL